MDKVPPHLRSEEAFKGFLGTINCNHCQLLVDGKCTHENADEHESDKKIISELDKNKDREINSYFVCQNLKDKPDIFVRLRHDHEPEVIVETEDQEDVKKKIDELELVQYSTAFVKHGKIKNLGLESDTFDYYILLPNRDYLKEIKLPL